MPESEKTGFWKRLSDTEVFTIIVSVVALIVSAYAALIELETHQDEAASEVIVDVYSEFRALTDLQVEWSEVSHLFEVLNYPEISDEVALAAKNSNSSELAALRLRERAVAFSIFTGFERLYFLHTQAVKVGDDTRARFLADMLDYYTEHLLINPRLRWLWSPSGGALFQQLEDETVHYYNENTNGGESDAPAAEMDSVGPFPKSSDTTQSAATTN